jgi:cell division protein FtsB
MGKWRVMRVHKFDVVVTCACVALLGYFAWHALEGPRGSRYRQAQAGESARLTDSLAAIHAQRVALEARVALLRPGSLDPDLLDEMARATLGVAKPNELIVIQEP